jgi:hypothetical protein
LVILEYGSEPFGFIKHGSFLDWGEVLLTFQEGFFGIERSDASISENIESA